MISNIDNDKTIWDILFRCPIVVQNKCHETALNWESNCDARFKLYDLKLTFQMQWLNDLLMNLVQLTVLIYHQPVTG